MLNTELSLSSEMQMLRHSGDHHDAETRALTVSSQGRHSQRGAIHVAETARELRC